MIRLLKEQDVNIEVKHEGILEVPEGKNVDDLPMSHFEKLVQKNGLSKITRALNNIQVWNTNRNPKLSKWAHNMINKLKSLSVSNQSDGNGCLNIKCESFHPIKGFALGFPTTEKFA